MEKTVRKNFLRIKHFILITIVALFFTAFSGFSIIAQSGGFENKTVFGSEISLPEGVDSWEDVYISRGSSIMGIKSECAHLTELYIPEKINNVSITEIASNAFSANNTLLRVDMPYITEIGDYAFINCISLTDVNIPEVTSIGSMAFMNCYSLMKITVPSSVTSIGSKAFSSCNKLVQIINYSGLELNGLPANLGQEILTSEELNFANTLSTQDGVTLFTVTNADEDNGVYLIDGGNSAVLDLSLETIKGVYNYAFYGNETLTQITLPDSCTSVRDYAFRYCYSLMKITIPSSVTTIGSNAFSGCYKLVQIRNYSNQPLNGLPANLGQEIRTSAEGDFVNTLSTQDGVTLFTVTNADEDNGVYLIDGGNSAVLDLSLETIKGVYNYAFYGNETLTQITLPDSCTSVRDYAFYECANLTKIDLPNVTSVGDNAFRYCSNLIEIDLPNVTSVGNYAFYECANLTETHLPNVTSVGESAFDGCISLIEMDLPEATTIGKNAFTGCVSLTDVNIPEVTNMGDYAFQSCTNLTEVNIPKATSIGICAFRNCSSLMKITIPSSVTTIGSNAFSSCYKLVQIRNYSNQTLNGLPENLGQEILTSEELNFANTLSTQDGVTLFTVTNADEDNGVYLIDGGNSAVLDLSLETIKGVYNYAFYGNETLTQITLPDSCTSVRDNAFKSCTNLTETHLPNVTSVGNYAFYECANLTETHLPNVTSVGHCAFRSCSNLIEIDLPNVTSVGNYAFGYCSNLIEIDLPNVTSVGIYAFRYCSNLIEIDLPNVTSVGNYAFADCSSLMKITIPSSVTTIGSNAFSSCYKLVQIRNDSNQTLNGLPENLGQEIRTSAEGDFVNTLSTQDGVTLFTVTNASEDNGVYLIDGGNSDVLDLSDKTFDGVYNYAFYGNETLTQITLPESCTSVRDYAFYECANLTKIDLPEATTIGEQAFYGCTKLNEVILPKATEIGEQAFYDCSSLIEMDLPEATTIGRMAFLDCTKLNEVILPKATEIGEMAFYGCTSLTQVSLPEVTTIGYQAFYDCSSLTEINLPKATEIGVRAFYNCTKLNEVILSKATEIGEMAFYGCANLTKIDLLEMTTIGYQAFYGFTKLNEVILPKATEIGEMAFYGCTSLTQVSLPEVTTIGEMAFYGCTSLTEINLPKATEIEVRAFLDCTKLNEVNSPQVTTLKEMAFYGCTSLTEINLPKATEIGVRAFLGCTSLIEVNSPQVTTLKEMAFYGCISLAKVSLPSVITIEHNAFNGCSSLTRVNSEKDGVLEIPASIASIGVCAFQDCSKIVDVYIPIEFAGFESSVFNNKDIKLRVFGRKAIDSREDILTYTAGLNGGLHYSLYVHAQDREAYDSSDFGLDENCTICSGSYVVKFFNDSEEIKTMTIEDALPKLSENDFPELEINAGYYNDEGWYTDTDLTQQYDLDTELTDNLNLYTGTFATTYNIVYSNNLNEEGLEYNNPTAYTIEDKITLTNPSEITGYNFLGWFLNDEAITKVEGLTGDLEIEARFSAQSYSITYTNNLDREGVTYNNQTAYTIEDTRTLEQPESITGYTFTGWFLNDEAITKVEGLTGNLEIEARYSAQSYSITYTNNLDREGVTYNNPTAYTIEDTLTLEQPESITGYNFLGWSLKISETGNETISKIENRVGNLVIQAQYEVIVYTITYTDNLEKEDITHNNPTTYTIEDTLTLEEPESITGYNFLGWFLNDEAITKVEGSTGDLAIEARFSAQSYSITYTDNLEKEDITHNNPTTYTIEDKITLTNPSEITGYEFINWSLKISETENETISKIENRVGNLVIQAQYKVIVYTIVYKVEGEVSESSYTILDDDIVLEPAQKLGNDFLGWRDTETGEYITVVNSSFARDVTLVAEFQINKYVLWTYIGGAVLLVVAFALMLTYNVLLKKRRRVVIKKPSIGTSGEAVTAKHTKKENDKKD